MSALEKIAVFSCNDLIGLLVLNRVIPNMRSIGYEPVIFYTADHRNRRFKIPTPPAISFFNTGILRDVLTPLLEQKGFSNAPNCTLRQLSTIHEIEYHEIENVNDPSLVHTLCNDQSMRGAIVVRFLQVFEKEIISTFRNKGFVWNLHSGLLPKYKGLLTPYRAIANNEKTYGVSLHDLTCGIDEGDIIERGELPLDKSRPILDLYMDAVPVSSQIILDNLAKYKNNGSVDLVPQNDPAILSYYTNPTSQEYFQFMSAGIIYADPQSTIDRIAAQFSEIGTSHHLILKNKLEQAVHGRVLEPLGVKTRTA